MSRRSRRLRAAPQAPSPPMSTASGTEKFATKQSLEPKWFVAVVVVHIRWKPIGTLRGDDSRRQGHWDSTSSWTESKNARFCKKITHVTSHLGVKHPTTPLPLALDDEELWVIEGCKKSVEPSCQLVTICIMQAFTPGESPPRFPMIYGIGTATICCMNMHKLNHLHIFAVRSRS